MPSDKFCCVYGCSESGGMHKVLHGFPNPEKDRERFNSWMYAIGGDILGLSNDMVYKFRRVCHAHFEEKYLCRNDRISNIAIPTLNLPGPLAWMEYPSCVMKPKHKKQKKNIQLQKDSALPSSPVDSEPSPNIKN